MLARQTLVRAATKAAGGAPPAARNMATLREIEMRLKSVKNIEKITKVSRDAEILTFRLLSLMPRYSR